MTTVGVLHLGSMGTALGRALIAAGNDVLYASEGRSERTRERARDSGATDVGNLAALSSRCQVLVAICPPAVAADVASDVAATGFTGIYLDANAVAPSTAVAIAATVERGGATFVDGAVIGPADFQRRRTHLLLAGRQASAVAGLFGDDGPATVALDGPPGTASAIKVCYAAWTKGTSALLISIRALAAHSQVEDELLRVWATRDEDLERRSARAVEKASTHGWRWDGEVEEIARAFADAGLPDGFHRAAAAVFATFPRREEETWLPSDELLSRFSPGGRSPLDDRDPSAHEHLEGG